MNTYANRSQIATENTDRTPIVCAGCGWSGRDGCTCDGRLDARAAELVRAFLDAGDRLDERRRVVAEMKAWRTRDTIRRLERKQEEALIARSKADKVRRMRGLTDGRLGGRLALHLFRKIAQPGIAGGVQAVDELARRHRVPVEMVRALRQRYLRQAFVAAAVAQ